MAKLYPPSIESKLPASYGKKLIIPFQHSRAVGAGQYKDMALLVKHATTNIEIGVIKAGLNVSYIYSPVSFNIAALSQPLVEGQYYKVQLAYIDINDTIGVYSTPAIIKYTAQPNLSIKYDQDKNITGMYQNADLTETVYSYQFDVVDINYDLLESSNVQLHSYQQDISTAQGTQDSYTLTCPLGIRSLPVDTATNKTPAIIKYQINTINDLQMCSYLTVYPQTYTDIGTINTTSDMDAGMVHILAEGPTYRINLNDNKIQQVSAKDYTVEQGVPYEYRVMNNTKIGYYNAQVTPDFEDMFLADETRQLCIRFNPKVGSFKETVQESKLNTIGGQFPITFRNGNIQYKEFSISGLISYEMDNNQLFMPNNMKTPMDSMHAHANALPDDIPVGLTPSMQMAMERQFKLEVLKWLNNGQPKLFRSPAEGNYIVRLTNVSLTPNDQLGRLLHTFNASAYEIAEYNFENLQKYKVIFKGAQ